MMRRSVALSLLLIVAFLLASCAPAANAVVAVPTAGAAAIASTGPQMQVGSPWPYVDGTLLVPVPAGPFTMGNDMPDSPVHTVTLSDFWIYSTKVTNQQFAACVAGGGCTAPDAGDNPVYADPASAENPVVGVTYDQAAAYCTSVHARLPTEAEWEKTARGPDANVYPWGNADPTCDLLNFNKCVGQTTSVTTYPQGQSYYQALDMEGNANEWVADRYEAAYYKQSPAQDPPGPDTGKFRSVRASNFDSQAVLVPAATRSFELPENHRNDLGFRCVVLDPGYFAPFCQTVVVTGLGTTPKIEGCPPPTFRLEPTCLDGKTSGSYITIDGLLMPPDAYVKAPSSCERISAVKYFCPPSEMGKPGLEVWATCKFKGTDAGCVKGYHYDAGKEACLPDPGATSSAVCLPGYNYDPASQCCSAIPGSLRAYAPCPPGYGFMKDKNRCANGVVYRPGLVTGGECPRKDKPPDEGPPPCVGPNCP
jgi:formylglycine-generating enzyme required for sulfatase activity